MHFSTVLLLTLLPFSLARKGGPAPMKGSGNGLQAKKDSYIVVFKEGTSATKMREFRGKADKAAKGKKKAGAKGGFGLGKAKGFPLETDEQGLAEIRDSDDVKYVEIDNVVTSSGIMPRKPPGPSKNRPRPPPKTKGSPKEAPTVAAASIPVQETSDLAVAEDSPRKRRPHPNPGSSNTEKPPGNGRTKKWAEVPHCDDEENPGPCFGHPEPLSKGGRKKDPKTGVEIDEGMELAEADFSDEEAAVLAMGGVEDEFEEEEYDFEDLGGVVGEEGLVGGGSGEGKGWWENVDRDDDEWWRGPEGNEEAGFTASNKRGRSFGGDGDGGQGGLVKRAITRQTGLDLYSLHRISHRYWEHDTEWDEYVYDDSAGSTAWVYVIDTGVHVKHGEFEGRARKGMNFVDYEYNIDYDGHGTHVAGTVAGKTYGVAKQANIISVKVLDGEASGWNSWVIGGVQWACKHARRNSRAVRTVINLSVGGAYSQALNDVINGCVDTYGVTIIAAAGNDNANATSTSPASASKAIAVAASDTYNQRASWSNWGISVDLYAPGVGIKSARAIVGGFVRWSGTSMAAPHVSGMAAYLITLKGLRGYRMVRNAIMTSTQRWVIRKNIAATTNAMIYNGAA